MSHYEYRVVPAPRKGRKAKGLKTGEARFANGLEAELNALAAEGWEFQRAECLPCEERQGLFRSLRTEEHHVLVFRRPRGAPAATDTGGAPALFAARANQPGVAVTGVPPLTRAAEPQAPGTASSHTDADFGVAEDAPAKSDAD